MSVSAQRGAQEASDVAGASANRLSNRSSSELSAAAAVIPECSMALTRDLKLPLEPFARSANTAGTLY
jgi:hypothetical protein